MWYNLILAVSLWAVIFILIPWERIRRLWPVAAISAAWLFVVNLVFIQLGYYKFTQAIVFIAGIPLFHLIGGAAGGILLMNWMPRSPLYKMLFIVAASGLIALVEVIAISKGVFTHLNGFNWFISILQSIATLSFLVWFSLAAMGERLYEGNSMRRNKI